KIAEAGLPCIVSTLYTPTRKYDNYKRPYQNPGLLHEAGVELAITADNNVENVRNLLYNAGYAAAYGLGKEEALKAVTINTAEIFGVDDLLGSIEEGKQANLFIADGDPFEPATHIKQVFIRGHKIPMVSRQTQLYEEYLDRGSESAQKGESTAMERFELPGPYPSFTALRWCSAGKPAPNYLRWGYESTLKAAKYFVTYTP